MNGCTFFHFLEPSHVHYCEEKTFSLVLLKDIFNFKGDFIVQFLDLCEKELSQPVDQVEPARLESLLELALRTSSANYDVNKVSTFYKKKLNCS